jgi:hypothetical protein
VHAVVALALPAVEAFDLAIAAQVFADPGLPRRYEFTVCVMSDSGAGGQGRAEVRRWIGGCGAAAPGDMPVGADEDRSVA